MEGSQFIDRKPEVENTSIHDKLKDAGVFQFALDVIRKGGHSESDPLEAHFAMDGFLPSVETEIMRLKQDKFFEVAHLFVEVKIKGEELKQKFWILAKAKTNWFKDKENVSALDAFENIRKEVPRLKKEFGEAWKKLQEAVSELPEWVDGEGER